LFRYRDVSLTANRRYLEALAAVDDPTPAIEALDKITQRKRTRAGHSVRAFNPLSREDRQVFEALSSGEHPGRTLGVVGVIPDGRRACGTLAIRPYRCSRRSSRDTLTGELLHGLSRSLEHLTLDELFAQIVIGKAADAESSGNT
jgi:hypothetical protein